MEKWIYGPCQVTSSYRKVGFLLDDDEVPEAIVQKWSKFDISRNLWEDLASKKSMVWYTVCHQLSVFLLFCCVFSIVSKALMQFEMDTRPWCISRRIVLDEINVAPNFRYPCSNKKQSFFLKNHPHPWLEIHFFPIAFRKRLWLRMFKSKTASLSVQAKAGHGHLQLVQQWGLDPTELIPFWFLGPRGDLIFTKNFLR